MTGINFSPDKMLKAMYQRAIKRNLKVFIAGLIIFLGGCRIKSEPELFLIPDNYEGVVIVLFNQSNGEEEKYIDNRRLYDIPKNGILATKFPKTTHGKLDQKFYYKDNNGNKKTEIQPYSSGTTDERRNYIMNGVYGNFTNNLDSANPNKYPINYKMFTIGKIKDKDSLQALSDSFLQKFIYNY